jgi:death-on-curing protein
MAGAYLFHVVQNHPSVDGNKRAGALAARVFLLMNDAKFDPTELDYGDLVLAVAPGRADKAACIAFFKQHVK